MTSTSWPGPQPLTGSPSASPRPRRGPRTILTAPDKNGTASGLDKLITGSPSWTEGSAGPYGVVFVAGKLDFLSVLDFKVSGYFLLSPALVSLEANFYAGANFLNLASGSVSGHLFFSSQGEFELSAHGTVQLGPDGFNITVGGPGITYWIPTARKNSASRGL